VPEPDPPVVDSVSAKLPGPKVVEITRGDVGALRVVDAMV
jgi:hypothetical protein